MASVKPSFEIVHFIAAYDDLFIKVAEHGYFEAAVGMHQYIFNSVDVENERAVDPEEHVWIEDRLECLEGVVDDEFFILKGNQVHVATICVKHGDLIRCDRSNMLADLDHKSFFMSAVVASIDDLLDALRLVFRRS